MIYYIYELQQQMIQLEEDEDEEKKIIKNYECIIVCNYS